MRRNTLAAVLAAAVLVPLTALVLVGRAQSQPDADERDRNLLDVSDDPPQTGRTLGSLTGPQPSQPPPTPASLERAQGDLLEPQGATIRTNRYELRALSGERVVVFDGETGRVYTTDLRDGSQVIVDPVIGDVIRRDLAERDARTRIRTATRALIALRKNDRDAFLKTITARLRNERYEHFDAWFERLREFGQRDIEPRHLANQATFSWEQGELKIDGFEGQ